ncbi:hypothetical protein [Ruminococcus sp.]|uniref:hypothetical protein n=1 Tax=Ruminococcus sp. TaxID=41978 RepID=UPI0025EE5672|nr:hypothetical protein [Ruminococcus sp.]
MNNVIKKISAFAMAFTLLGTGTTIAKTVNPESFSIGITADAACSHNMPRATYSEWVGTGQPREMYDWRFNWLSLHIQYKYKYYQQRAVTWHCNSCGKYLYTTYEYRTYYDDTWVNA